MSTQIDVQTEQAYSEQYNEVLEQLYDKIEGSAKAAVAFAPPQRHDGPGDHPSCQCGLEIRKRNRDE